MLCEKCGDAPATVHLTDVINNVKKEHHLCEPCYESSDLGLPFSMEVLSDIMGKESDPLIDMHLVQKMVSEQLPSAAPDIACDTCGADLESFQKRGAVGCPNDYDVFAREFEPLMVKLHGAHEHVGKVPKNYETQRARDHQIAQLQTELRHAVTDEQYEDAARLRDRNEALQETGESNETQ